MAVRNTCIGKPSNVTPVMDSVGSGSYIMDVSDYWTRQTLMDKERVIRGAGVIVDPIIRFLEDTERAESRKVLIQALTYLDLPGLDEEEEALVAAAKRVIQRRLLEL